MGNKLRKEFFTFEFPNGILPLNNLELFLRIVLQNYSLRSAFENITQQAP